jgi:hypothetical protein
MILFKKEDSAYLLLTVLSNADSSTFLGHSITAVIDKCKCKDDFDWLITQLKDYVKDSRENLARAVGNEACDLIDKYKPFVNKET